MDTDGLLVVEQVVAEFLGIVEHFPEHQELLQILMVVVEQVVELHHLSDLLEFKEL
jgi:hypothetical protein